MDEELVRRMGLISTYLNTPRKAFLSPPSTPAALPPPSSPSAGPLTTPSPPFVATGGRFWCLSPSDLTRLSSFLAAASKYSDVILLALNLEKDRCSTTEWLQATEWAGKVRIIPVLPYFSSTSAMNALLITAFHVHATYLLYQSTFIIAQPHHINALLAHFSPSTFAVGLCLPSHLPSCQSASPTSRLTPTSTPSNAFAMWHVDTVVMVGWGVAEEGGMITLVQRIGGVRQKAKLVGGVKGLEGVGLEGDQKRLEQRVKKFQEMEKMEWQGGTVAVIIAEEGEQGGGGSEKSSIHITH